MPGLWLPRNVIQEREQQIEAAEARARWVPPKSQFEMDCEELLALIRDGAAEPAGILARRIATKAYDDRLNRCFCEDTGYPYFHECDY